MDFENTDEIADVESNIDFEQEPLDDAALSFSDEAVNSQTNEYDEVIDASLARISANLVAQNSYAREANIENALATDPVKFGKAKRLAERRGTDVGLVFDNFEEFEARDKQLLLDDIVKKNPALKELAATSPEFMTLAANDCDKLQEISNNLTIFGTMSEPIAPVAIAKKAAYVYNEKDRQLDMFVEIGNLMGKNDPESEARLAVLIDEVNKAPLVDTSELEMIGYQWIEGIPYQKKTLLPIVVGTAGGAAVDAVVSAKVGAASGAAVGSVVPGAGTAAGAAVGSSVGAVVGTIKGATIGYAVGNLVAFDYAFRIERGGMYADLAVMKDENGQGFDKGDMETVSDTYGVLSAAVELLPLERMARLVPGYDVAKKGILKKGFKKAVQETLKNKTKAQAIRGILKDVSFAAGYQGLEEAAQELLQVIGERHLQDEYNDKIGYNFEKNDWGDDAERIGSAGYQGVKASLLLPVLGGAGRAYVETRAVNEMQAINSLQLGDEAKAEFDNMRMDKMQNTIQQLGELKENPEQVQAFLQRAARNSDMRDIYMSVEDAKAVLASDAVKKNMDAMKKLGVMDSIERQLANSADTGAAVKIAFEDYGATVLSRQELYGAFKDIVKTYEDGVTMNELRQHQKTVENVVKEGQKLKEQNKADFDYIYDRILENARVSGIPSEQSKLAAEQNTYFYLGLARMHNLSAVQMFQQDGLNFDYKIDNSKARSAQLDKIIEVIRDEQLKGADQNLLRASRVVARKDINEIKKTLNRKIENPNTADVKEYLRVLNAISDMKINLENMTTEDLAAQLQAYAAQSPVMVDIKRSDADRVKSGIFSSSEKALADIQAQGAAGDYVLVGGGRVPVDYEIVELSDMITSHNMEGAVNETYPQELQPRDRSRSASDAQINEIVNSFAPERVAKAPTATEGAPIVTKQGYVAVGNGRALALGKVYENVAKAEQYRQYLIEQGYNVEGYAEPVLVRRLAVDLDVKQLLALVDDANTSGTMQYSDAEKAITYSKKLTGEIIDLLDTDAELMNAANRRFIREFFANVIPTAERNSFLDKDDKVTRKGIEMIENTLTAIIVPDARFLSVLVENPDNNIRKITAGLAKSAPAIVSFENDVQSGLIDAKYSLATDIRQAVEVLKRAKDKGQNLDLYVKQLDLLEGSLPAEVLVVAEMFDKSHSAVDFADKIKSYIHNASAQGDLSQGNMFGMEPVAKIVLLERMNAQSGLFQGNVVDENGGVALKIVTKEEMQGLSDDDFKHKMLDTLKSLKGKKIFNKSLNGDIEIRTSSIKKYKSFFADNNKKLIVPYITELLGKARFERIEEPYNKRETSIKAYYKADLPIAIDNDVYNAALTVREDQYGDFFWDAQIKEKPQKTTPATNPGGLRLKADETAYGESITIDKKNVNNTLYQQAAGHLFRPSRMDSNNYLNDLKKAEQSGADANTFVRLGDLPKVYELLGIPAGKVATNKRIIVKDTIQKHQVPMNIVDRLPELFADPLIVFKALDSSTNPNAFVAVLDAVDKDGKQMIAALAPNEKGGVYHFVTSFYGKDKIETMLKKAIAENKVKYVKDKKNSLLLRPNAQLVQAMNLKGMDESNLGYDNPGRPSTSSPNQNMIANEEDVVKRYLQLDKTEVLGSFSPSTLTITLFKNANLSTLIHESGHFWREMIRKYATTDGASEQLKAYSETLENWLDNEWSKHNEVFVQPDGSYTLFYKGSAVQEGFATFDAAVEVAKHECFARGIENYFMTAEAPSFGLRKIFSSFKRWLSGVYNNANELNVEITPEVKEVFDRLLASDGEIEQYVMEKRIRQLFDAPDKANMSQKQFEKYKEYMDNLLTIAKDDYYKSLAATAFKEKTAEFEAKKALMQHDVLMEFSTTPENRFVIALVFGKIGDADVDIKANTAEIMATYNAVVANGVDRLPKRQDGVLIFADDGMNFSELSDFFGLDIDVIKKTISGSPRLVTAIDDTLRYRVHESIGSPVSYAEVEAEIVKSIHNDKYFDMLSLELSKISPNPENQGALEHALQAKAEDIIGNVRITDIKPETYFKQSLRAGDRAMSALNRGNKSAAYSYKRQQLMNFFLYKEAQKQAENVDKSVRRLKEIGKKEVNPNVNQQHQDAARAILSRYSLASVLSQKQKERLGNLSRWIDEQRAAGYDIEIPTSILEAIDKKPYNEMSVNELIALSDLIKNIIHNGREVSTYELNGQLLEKEKLLEQFSKQFEKSYKPLAKGKTGKQEKHHLQDLGNTIDEMLITLGGLCNRIDDGNANGVAHTAFLRPLADAQNLENDLLRRFGKKMNELNSGLSEETKAALFENVAGARDALGSEYTLSELISIGLNMGNYYNKQRMRTNFGDNSQFDRKMGWVAAKLTKEHWDYIQGVWDLLDSMYPMLSEHQKKMSGLDMDQVLATKVVTPFGTYRGGYYPIIYDKTASMEARDKNNAETALLESDYGRATTAKGYTKSRLDRVKAPLKFGLAPISQHIASVVHDVAYRKTIRQLWNLANSPSFMETFDTYLESEYRDGLCQLLKTVANQPNRDSRTAKKLDAYLRIIRNRTTTIGLAYRFTTAVMQSLGVFSSIAVMSQRGRKNGGKHNGYYWLRRGIKSFMQSSENREWALANSGELRARLNNNDVNISEAMKGVANEISRKQKVADTMIKGGFWLIGKMDFIVAQSTWFAAYNQATQDFGYNHKDAVFYADRIMIDSQGTGNLKDTPLFQRGSELSKSMAMFYSPFAALYQIWTQSAKDIKDKKEFAGALSDLFTLLVLPPLVEGILKGDAPGADDDLAEWIKYLLANPLFYWMSSIPIVRDAASVMDFGRVPGSVYANAFNTIFQPVKKIYKIANGDDVKSSSFVKDLMNAVAMTTGVPIGGQVADWASYSSGVASGEVKAESPADILYGIYRGKERK